MVNVQSHTLQVDRAGEEPSGTEEEIAQRTRSKHPLHDVSITSLEAGLGFVEGEDPPTPRELDPDELWWHEWLNSLTTDTLNGNNSCTCVYREKKLFFMCNMYMYFNVYVYV